MKNILARSVAFLLVFVFVASPVWATCGGGGGGGGGGMSGAGGNNGGGENPAVYRVPWKGYDPKGPAASRSGLVVHWFVAATSTEGARTEIKQSGLLESRDLALYAKQCVTMQLDEISEPNGKKLVGDSKLPVIVLATADDTPIGKAENVGGKIKLADVEKLVGNEVKTRKANVDTTMKDAKVKAAAGDKPGAIALYQNVVAEKCMFADKAKDAAKELKKLGVEENIGQMFPEPNFDPAVSQAIVKLMKKGLVAENAGQYILAEQFYSRARSLDAADPTPLRYLA